MGSSRVRFGVKVVVKIGGQGQESRLLSRSWVKVRVMIGGHKVRVKVVGSSSG